MKYADVRLKYRLDEAFFAVTQFYSTPLSDPKLVSMMLRLHKFFAVSFILGAVV